MRVCLQGIGTRGDVEPLVAIAQALRAAGHEAVAVVNVDQAGFARQAGLQVQATFDFDFSALMARFDARGRLGGWAMWVRFWSHPPAAHREQVLDAAWVGAEGCDVVLATPLVWAARLVAEARGVPFAYLALQPSLGPTARFPNPLVAGRSLVPLLNRLTFTLHDLTMSPGRRSLRRAVRRLGLPRARGRSGALTFRGRPAPRLQRLSSALVAAPDDWPEHVVAVPSLEARGASEAMPPGL